LLLQLPPKFEFQPDVARNFFHMARSRYEGALAIEPRHATWFFPEAEALMVAYRVARVGADPPRAPGGDEAGGYRGLSYLRLHGSPRVYFSAYPSAQLISMRDELNLLPGQRWCVFDNTASGAAAANALELQSMLAR
jgi:uncharacterized protein YecE (DUF72 family)